jgi:hypothetical protein
MRFETNGAVLAADVAAAPRDLLGEGDRDVQPGRGSPRSRVVEHVGHGHLVAEEELVVGVVGGPVQRDVVAPRVRGVPLEEPAPLGRSSRSAVPRGGGWRCAERERIVVPAW